jgi:hypothetical protein
LFILFPLKAEYIFSVSACPAQEQGKAGREETENGKYFT